MRDYGFRRDFWIDIHQPYTYDLELALSFVSLSVYLILSRRSIASYKKRIENSFSSTHKIALKWLDRLHLVLFVVSFFWLLETITRMVWQEYTATPFSSITLGLIVAFIGIGALLQGDLAPIKEEALVEESPDEARKSISEKEKEKISRIEKLMKERQHYLQPDLTLKEFARRIDLPARETSRLINQGLDLSFIDFVNQYRIEHFKHISADKKNAHLSLLGMAFESGFNSKSTFNRVFKNAEGMSPSSYVNAS